MKLLLENWRQFVREEESNELMAESAAAESEEIATKLVADFVKKVKAEKGDEAEKESGEIVEEKELLNEDFGASFVIVVILPFFLKLMGGVALSAVVAKGGAWWAKKAGKDEASERLSKLGDLLEWVTTTMATARIFRGADMIVNWYFGKKCQQLPGWPDNPDALRCGSDDRRTRKKWKTRINVLEKTVVFGVLITISATELYKAATEAGSLASAMAEMFSKAGLEDDTARQALIDAFAAATDSADVAKAGQTAANPFQRRMFWGHLKRTIKAMWSGA